MPTTSSTIDLTDTRATAGSHASSTEDEAYTTARVRTVGTNSMFLTASEGILTGNPCASPQEGHCERRVVYAGHQRQSRRLSSP